MYSSVNVSRRDSEWLYCLKDRETDMPGIFSVDCPLSGAMYRAGRQSLELPQPPSEGRSGSKLTGHRKTLQLWVYDDVEV